MSNYFKLNPRLLARFFPADEEGYALVEFGFYFGFHFLDGYRRDYRRRAANVAADYYRLFGSHLRWMITPLKCLWKPVPENYTMDAWLAAFPDKDWVWSMILHSGRVESEAAQYQIVGNGNSTQTGKCSDLYLFLPATQFFAEPRQDPFELYQKWAEMLQARHGTAGFGLVPPEDTPKRGRTTALAASFGKEFPGVEIADSLNTRNARLGLLSANWLNLIDSDYVEQLGGIPAIKERLGREPLGHLVGLHPYEGGLILSSGEYPVLYENEEPRKPPSVYGPVARLLKLLRTHEPLGRWGCPKDESLDWLARFDEAGL